MKGTVKAQHTLPVQFPHCQFDGGLNRFGTAVTEEHSVISGQLLLFFRKSDRRVGKEVCEDGGFKEIFLHNDSSISIKVYKNFSDFYIKRDLFRDDA